MSSVYSDRRLWRYTCLLIMLLAFTTGASAADGMMDLLGDDLQMDGGIMDFVREKNAVVIRNYGTVQFGNTKIQARNMVYHKETNEVYAEGNVVFEETGGSAFFCDRIFFNVSEWRGYAENVRLKAENSAAAIPVRGFLEESAQHTAARQDDTVATTGQVKRMFAAGNEVRAINKEHIEVLGATVTPSAFAVPHVSVKSTAVNIRRGEKIESWHNVLKIGKVPVFYLPYIIKDLKYDWPWMRVTGGHTDEWGAFVRTKWGVDFDPDPLAPFRLEKMFFDLDYIQDRGWGSGLAAKYSLGKLDSWGKLETYYIRETNIGTNADWDRGTEQNESIAYKSDPSWQPDLYKDDGRWGIDWKHYQEFNELWDLRMEAHLYSDRDYRYEYDELGYKTDKEPETGFDLRRLSKHWILEFVGNKRVNNWQSQSEHLGVRAYVPGLRLARTPLYVKADIRAEVVNRHYDRLLDEYEQLENNTRKIKSGDDYDEFGRVHGEVTLDAPIHLGSFAVLRPWATARVTWYEELYGRTIDDVMLTPDELNDRVNNRYRDNHVDGEDNKTNIAFPWGVELSSRFYGNFKNGIWRHVIEPTISYTVNQDPSIRPHRLYYIDEIDTYNEEHFLTFQLHQKLQKKEDNGAIRDVVDFDAQFRFYPYDNEAEARNFDRNTTEIELDLIYRPIEHFTLWANALYDSEDNQFNRSSVAIDWRYKNMFRAFVGHYSYRGDYWRYPGSYDVEQTVVSLRTKLWNKHSKYAAEIAATYDWPNNPQAFNGIVEERFTLFRDWDTFELAVSFVNDKRDDDKGIFLQITPKGWMGFARESSVVDSASQQAGARYDDKENTSSHATSDQKVKTE